MGSVGGWGGITLGCSELARGRSCSAMVHSVHMQCVCVCVYVCVYDCVSMVCVFMCAGACGVMWVGDHAMFLLPHPPNLLMPVPPPAGGA